MRVNDRRKNKDPGGGVGVGEKERKAERKEKRTEKGEREIDLRRELERASRARDHTQDRQLRGVAGGVRRGGRGFLQTPWPAWQHSDFKDPLGPDGI